MSEVCVEVLHSSGGLSCVQLDLDCVYVSRYFGYSHVCLFCVCVCLFCVCVCVCVCMCVYMYVYFVSVCVCVFILCMCVYSVWFSIRTPVSLCWSFLLHMFTIKTDSLPSLHPHMFHTLCMNLFLLKYSKYSLPNI